MKSSVEEINSEALEELSQDDFYKAQKLFQKNVKQNPCFISYNNLGVFYITEGIINSDGNIRRAGKLGVTYLKKALTYQKSHLTFSALGCVSFENKNYEEASFYFEQACEKKKDYMTMYNLALSLYRQCKYKEAIIWLEKALEVCDSSDYAEICATYVFSLMKVDRGKCNEELKHLLKDNTTHMEYDKFILAYLCEDLQEAEQLISQLFKYFYINLDEMAMVFDCLFKLNKKKEAEQYLNNKVKELSESDFVNKSEIMRFKKIFIESEYRNKIISSYKYIRSIITQCYYYGCKLHNS